MKHQRDITLYETSKGYITLYGVYNVQILFDVWLLYVISIYIYSASALLDSVVTNKWFEGLYHFLITQWVYRNTFSLISNSHFPLTVALFSRS
jgi:hypothetical protein